MVFWGGRRRGAGRKPRGAKAGVPHKTRPVLAPRYPVHVTCKLLPGLPNLRSTFAHVVLRGAFESGADRFGFRLVEYSIQTNHLHLLCEAKDRRALWRGMQGLSVRIAKRLNRLWDRKGTVFADRYHARILKTPREVRRALAYVLHNARRHGLRVAGIDSFTTGPWFAGWRERIPESWRSTIERPTLLARTWLLAAGWRRLGLVGVGEVPRAG